MKLAALCCTYLRPHMLGHLIESFLRQDYPKELRELIILDDAGQYDNQEGDGWRLFSIPRRFRTLGEKRNACAALASADAEGLVVADDDDIYLPHWLRTQAEALKRADWSRPSLVLSEQGGSLREQDTGGLFHASWAFRRCAFDKVRGYAAVNNGEDQELAGRLAVTGARQFDPCELAPPFFVCRQDGSTYHLSWMGARGYEELGKRKAGGKAKLTVAWPRDYTAMPVVKRYHFGPHVSHRDGKMPAELIGPVDSAGRNGPTNGMAALQQALRKRIADGLDWLSIRPLPASKGALPWFWNFADRRYAAWWDAQGLPFVQGPNMLFCNSGRPRVDREECALLDAANCQAMFCHSEWYRDLIAKHRGKRNSSPIYMWPYPVDPWPGEPLSAEYDLLIYAKNGSRPQLLEYLAEVFPRHVQIHYGRYRREELYEAARRSRACAYLADDDHGPLALQEILLAGCPVVGVRTGAPFILRGVTGLLVNRLPPGRACVRNEADEVVLNDYLAATQEIQNFDRKEVRAAAAAEFSSARVTEGILAALDGLRLAPTGQR